MIKSVGNNKYVVESHKGKKLGKAMSKAKAIDRLRQVEYFKSMKVKV